MIIERGPLSDTLIGVQELMSQSLISRPARANISGLHRLMIRFSSVD